MQYYFLILLSNILLSISDNVIASTGLYHKPNFCINCKFFKKDLFTRNIYAKCALFPKDDYSYNKDYLVDGFEKINKVDYYYCSTARNIDSMCGEKGNLYMHKKK